MDDATRTQIRIFILVFLAFLPTVVLYGFASATLQERERTRQEAELRQIAQITQVEYQRLIDQSRQLLAALSEFPEIRNGQQPECSRRLESILDHAPRYTTISLIGADGYLECGSLTPDGALYLGDRAYYMLAMANNRFSVGEYAVGRITGKPTVGVAHPIEAADGSGVTKVLAAALDLSGLGVATAGTSLPSYSTLTVVDRAGNVLVRTPARRHPLGYDSIGARAPEGFVDLRQITGSDPVFVAGTDLDGVDRHFSVVPLRTGRTVGGYILVGKEEAMMLEEISAVERRDLRLLGIGALVVLALAWVFGHYGLVRSGEPGNPGRPPRPGPVPAV